MFRFLIFLAIVFGIYVIFYGTGAVASIDNALPAAMREPMMNLHESALNSLGQAFAQGRASLRDLGQAIANSFHH